MDGVGYRGDVEGEGSMAARMSEACGGEWMSEGLIRLLCEFSDPPLLLCCSIMLLLCWSDLHCVLLLLRVLG